MDCKPAPDVLELFLVIVVLIVQQIHVSVLILDLRNCCNFQRDKDEIDYFDEDLVDSCDSNSDDDD